MIKTLAVSNYRSLEELVLPLERLNVISGPNGSGKSNIYRALRLLAETAEGRLTEALAREGGFASALSAGKRTFSRQPSRMCLGFADDAFGYAIELGPPASGDISARSLFTLDPCIKRECIWGGAVFRPSAMLADRHNAVISVGEGRRRAAVASVSGFESLFSAAIDPACAPEIQALRERIRSWRFYGDLRTDARAPARQRRIGTFTPVLHNDGANLTAALQTIIEIGDSELLHQAVDDAFPGAKIEIAVSDGYFGLLVHQPGILRPLQAAELSDGTLRYLLCIATLLSPRPPQFLALNEPETSLHPDLFAALVRLIAAASRQTQIVIVTHEQALISALERTPNCNSLKLEKRDGRTLLSEAIDVDLPPWHWPSA